MPVLTNPHPIAPKYDLVIKDLLRDGRSIFLESVAGAPARRSLPVQYPNFSLLEVDLLYELVNNTLFHLDFQSYNEREAVLRMGGYSLPLHYTYRLPLSQCIAYIGRERMRMPKHLRVARHLYRCDIVDIREFEADTLMASGFPADLLLAVLANNGEKRVRDVLERLRDYEGRQRRRALSYLMTLSRLRDRVSGIIRQEHPIMPIRIEDLDLDNNPFFQEFRERTARDAESKGSREFATTLLTKQLTARFGPLSKAYLNRISNASIEQLEQWLTTLHTRKSLRDALS